MPHRFPPASAVAVLLAALGCSSDAEAPPTPPPIPVSTVTVTPRDVPLALEYLGQTAASRDIEIRARVAGFLEERHFAEGADVEAGAPLFTIDRRPLEAQRTAARAEVQVARAQLDQATREARRLEPLVAEDAITERERDDAVSAEAIAKATLAAAEARLAAIEVDLGYTAVDAPIAGKVGRALKEVGSFVEPGGMGGLLTTLVELDPIYAEFQRSSNEQFELEADLRSGRLALPDDGALEVELRHRNGEVLAKGGHIDFRAGTVDRRTASIPMRATLPNPDRRLLAGQAVRVVLRGAVLRDAIAIPQRAVVDGPQGKQVMVARPADPPRAARAGGFVVEPRPVTVGEWVDIESEAGGGVERAWIVLSGLAPGDRVIVDNLMKLRPGAPVAPDAPASGRAGDSDSTNGPQGEPR